MGAAVLSGTGGNPASAKGSEPPKPPAEIREKIFAKVRETPFIDTHEHLCDEAERLSGKNPFGGMPTTGRVVLSHYLSSDFLTAGMPDETIRKFYRVGCLARREMEAYRALLAGREEHGLRPAVRIAIRELYGVDELSASTVEQVQAGYVKMRQKGFYRHILCDLAKIESCQVNSHDEAF